MTRNLVINHNVLYVLLGHSLPSDKVSLSDEVPIYVCCTASKLLCNSKCYSSFSYENKQY